MTTPYAVYVKEFTARLQARVHQQAYATFMQQVERRVQTREGNLADARMEELRQLMFQHKRTFEPALKNKALALLQTMPLKSTSEDPYFAHTFTGLHACAYFHDITSPSAYNFINHITRHTFMLDGRAIFDFAKVLEQMRHPQAAEVMQILLPRIREVAGELTVTQARMLMEYLASLQLLDTALTTKLVAMMQAGVQDIDAVELSMCVRAMAVVSPAAVARDFITAATPRICQVLQESVAQRHCYKLLYFQKAGGAASSSTPSAGNSYGASIGDDGAASSSAGPSGVLAHVAPAELRASLLNEQWSAFHVLKAVTTLTTHLSWAPRRVLNEMVRTAVAWSEPDSLEAATPPTQHADEGESSATKEAAGHHTSTAGFEEAAKADYAEYVAKMPQLRRLDLSQLLKALHFSSYRHPTGLRLLSARVAAATDKSYVPSPHSNWVVDELPMAIEAVAYFYATDCLPAVLSMVEEVRVSYLSSLEASLRAERAVPAVLTPTQKISAEVVLLRTLLSCARLLSACAVAGAPAKTLSGGSGAAAAAAVAATPPKLLPSHRPVAPQLRRELRHHIIALATSPLLRLYLDYARVVGNQTGGETRTTHRRAIAGAAHALHSITVVFYSISQEVAASSTFERTALSVMDASALAALRKTVRELVKLMHTVAERRSNLLAAETAAEVRAALEMVQQHPEWLTAA